MTDSSSLIRIVQPVQPDEIYNLAAQSHVAVSFEEPEYTADSDAIGTLRLHQPANPPVPARTGGVGRKRRQRLRTAVGGHDRRRGESRLARRHRPHGAWWTDLPVASVVRTARTAALEAGDATPRRWARAL